MEKKNLLFNKFYSKLVLEGIIKSLIFGLIVGFSAGLISGFVTFLLIYSGWIAAIIAFVSGTAIGTVLFYKKVFQPTTKNVAERVDRLGLEERVITMMELEKDESYIAMRQREDAKEKLAVVNQKQLKISLFILPIVLVGVLAVLSASMVTISVLSASGRLPWTPPGVDDLPDETYTVSYLVDGEGGRIEGETEQRVDYGEDASLVVVVADYGYSFDMWSDGIEDPERQDLNVTENIEVTAIFAKMQESEGQTDGGEKGEPNGQGEEDTGEPSEPSDPGEDAEPDTGEPNPEGPPQEGPSTGQFEPGNQIIDGQTYYRDNGLYEEYLAECNRRIEEGEDLTPAQKEFIRLYFGIIV